jgi:t-SNARE complex subunit (syntaxin)
MVAEQRETVQRIDADTTDIADNISGAQRELLKYYASISSNRWLMIKVFGAIIVMVRTLLLPILHLLIILLVLTICSCKLTGHLFWLAIYGP